MCQANTSEDGWTPFENERRCLSCQASDNSGVKISLIADLQKGKGYAPGKHIPFPEHHISITPVSLLRPALRHSSDAP